MGTHFDPFPAGSQAAAALAASENPFMSRFENAVSARELRAMTRVLADTVIAQQRRHLHGRVGRITIDLEPTDDPPTASRSSRSSTATTTPGATCRSWPR